MFIKGNMLGVVTGKPNTSYVKTSSGEEKRKTKLVISCYKKKFKEPGYYQDRFTFTCWGDLSNVDISALKKGDLVFVEFGIVKRTFASEEGRWLTSTHYLINSLRKVSFVSLDTFGGDQYESEDEETLNDGETCIKDEEGNDTDIKLEDIFNISKK